MVEESINLQVLQWPTPQGKVPQGDDNSWGRPTVYILYSGKIIALSKAVSPRRAAL